ncbi:ABC transporter substrate-binding protein [Cronbergia sp. UHCC 0137]|uniref:ABC transporter substrate-binding protein n=1 Tax=Cronbergia sp. UHCC 0137 TaxID=3110239 RepID=UPI002B2040DE|nr:ABC transporter substrate-binding protein [Cronbergia sp. UHCC 0137]MEA5617670.1 ABC transporter substrate-binding protein [Cronbergia sp. UHCC 0137]
MIFLFQLFLVVVSCQGSKNSPVVSSVDNSCVQSYDANVDYFPNKVKVTHAMGFAVEYYNNYKVVTIKNPWKDAKTGFKYVLVQCGTPIPQGFEESQIFTTPVNSVISLSTTHLPHFAKLNLVDKLIGVSDIKQVTTAEFIDRIKAGSVVSVGNNSSVNVEKILELNPELITTFGTGNKQIDSFPKLLEAGLKVAINAEYMEDTPLGRSEWLKFTALFFNKEEESEKIFAEIANKYEDIVVKAKAVKKRPTVFVGFNFKGTWYTPGGNSYVAKYLADAGANYLWSEDKSSGSLPISFETVFERAANADYWLNFRQSWNNSKDVIIEDNRYGDFKAFKKGNLYNNNARINANGGNDYWQSGISNPDVVLSDLIKILHPEILPNHQLFYYQKLTQ